MTMNHCYIVVERNTLGAANWQQLCNLFATMGTHDSPFPMYNTVARERLDSDAVIYESNFYPGEITVANFKLLLANEFDVPVEDITDIRIITSYSTDNTTAVWEFSYNAVLRFTVRRFGRRSKWAISGDECRGYLSLYKDEWETNDF